MIDLSPLIQKAKDAAREADDLALKAKDAAREADDLALKAKESAREAEKLAIEKPAIEKPAIEKPAIEKPALEINDAKLDKKLLKKIDNLSAKHVKKLEAVGITVEQLRKRDAKTIRGIMAELKGSSHFKVTPLVVEASAALAFLGAALYKPSTGELANSSTLAGANGA